MTDAGAIHSEHRILAFDCSSCGRPQVMRVVSIHVQPSDEAEPVEYTYLVCPECSSPTLLSRDFDYGPDGFEGSAYTCQYPVQHRRLTFWMPPHVQHAYQEAVRCEEAEAWTATAVMVGKALEAICLEFEPRSTTIADGLRRILAAGLVSQELYDWGNGLRVVRNEGAHAGARVPAKDARIALDFLQALVEILFDLRERFAAWQEERAQRGLRGGTARIAEPTPAAGEGDGGPGDAVGP